LAANTTNGVTIAQAQRPKLWGEHPIDGKRQPLDAAADLVADRHFGRTAVMVAVNSEISETL
jgi:hypothetical protein